MANLLCTDTELTTVADAIRSKKGDSASTKYGFPTGMVNAIGALNVGTGLSPAASAADIRSGKKAVVNRQTITGNIPEKAAATITPSETAQEIAAGQYLAGKQTIAAISSTYVGSGVTRKAAATYNTSTSDQTIGASQYLTGAQTIRKVTTENIDAANIKYGVTVKVGDAGSSGRIKNVTGSYKPQLTEIGGWSYGFPASNMSVGASTSSATVIGTIDVDSDGRVYDVSISGGKSGLIPCCFISNNVVYIAVVNVSGSTISLSKNTYTVTPNISKIDY